MSQSDAYRPATPAENLRAILALHSDLSPAEKRELEEAAVLLSERVPQDLRRLRFGGRSEIRRSSQHQREGERMKRDQYWSKPKKARTDASGGAWWYANEGGIEVHVDANHNKLHVTVKIPRRTLAEYLRRVGREGKGGN